MILYLKLYRLLNWLPKIQRNDLSDIFSLIKLSIISLSIQEIGIEKLHEGSRYYFYRLKFQVHTLSDDDIQSILYDKYYLIRLLLAKSYINKYCPNNVLFKLLNDKSTKVRVEAVKVLSNQYSEKYSFILKDLLLDGSAIIRSITRKILSTSKNFNFHHFYVENIKNERVKVGAIIGLSEVGSKDDIEYLHSFLSSKTSSIKSAALLAIYKLDYTLAVREAYNIILEGNFNSAIKLSGKILINEGFDSQRIRNIYDSTSLIGKKVILKMFMIRGGWDTGGDFLKALMDSSETIQRIAEVYLDAWLRYTIRLAITKKEGDIEYIMQMYNEAKLKGIQVPHSIPFIVGGDK